MQDEKKDMKQSSEAAEFDLKTPDIITADTPSLAQLHEERKNSRRIQRFSSEFKQPEDDMKPLPLRTSAQQVMVFNLTHRNQRPKCPRPGFRILGIFPDIGTGEAFIHDNYRDSKETVFWANLFQLIPVMASTQRQSDLVACLAHVKELTGLHERVLAKANDDFEANIVNQRTGKVGLSAKARRDNLKKTRDKSSRMKLLKAKFAADTKSMPKSATHVAGSATISNQSHAVIVTLPDIRRSALVGAMELEPLFAVLFVGSVETCEHYSKFTASKALKGCSIDIVDMYSWLFPEDVNPDDIGKEVFGGAKLDLIMKTKRKTEALVEEYEATHKAQVVTINAEGDLKRQDSKTKK